MDLALTLKSESHDVNVSNIIECNDGDTLNKKGCEVNSVLMELCKENNIYLIYNSKKIKPQHINKGKLCLNQKGSHLLSDTFLKEISHMFNWQFRTENSDSEECISNLTLKFQKIMGQLKMLDTQMSYPIGVPIWVLQQNKSIRIMDNVVKVINN